MTKWGLAYNAYLSGKAYDSIPRETVLLFEAEGPWNNSGGSELLKPKRLKDKYLGIFDVQLDTALIAFMDGTVAKYRFSDGAIAIYDPNTRWLSGEAGIEQFAAFTTKNKYVPLHWKP